MICDGINRGCRSMAIQISGKTAWASRVQTSFVLYALNW